MTRRFLGDLDKLHAVFSDHFALQGVRTCINLHLDAINMASTKTTEFVFNLLSAGIHAVDGERSQMFPRDDVGGWGVFSSLQADGTG